MLRKFYYRLGTFWTIVVFTVASVLFSVSGTFLIILSLSGATEDWGSALMIATIIPLLVAPLMSSLQLRLLTQLDQERQEKAQLVIELQESLANVKTLKGLIPICASCKKIRDDEGFWQHLEVFIHNHSEAVLSHGYCPACAQAMKAEINALRETATPER